MTKELFISICKSKPGKQCLIILAVCSALALIAPKLLPEGSIVSFVELALCAVITVTCNRFSTIIQLAQMQKREEESKNK